MDRTARGGDRAASGGSRLVVILDRSPDGRRGARELGRRKGMSKAIRDWEGSGGEYAVVSIGGTGGRPRMDVAEDLDHLLGESLPRAFGAASDRKGAVATLVATDAGVRAEIERAIGAASRASGTWTAPAACPTGTVGICLCVEGRAPVMALMPEEDLVGALAAAVVDRMGGLPADPAAWWELAFSLRDGGDDGPDEAIAACLAAGWAALDEGGSGDAGPGMRIALSGLMVAGAGAWVNVGIAADGRMAMSCAAFAADMRTMMDAACTPTPARRRDS